MMGHPGVVLAWPCGVSRIVGEAYDLMEPLRRPETGWASADDENVDRTAEGQLAVRQAVKLPYISSLADPMVPCNSSWKLGTLFKVWRA